MLMRTAWLASALFAIAIGDVQTPTPPPAPPRDNVSVETAGPATAVLRGVVVAAESGAPLRRAMVRITNGTRPIRTVMTDAQGRYEVREVPAGRLTLSASKAGYLMLAYNQRRPFEPARPIDVADGQVLEGINFGLPRGGVIAVQVTDEAGEPLRGVEVAAERYAFSSSGEQRLTPVGATTPYATTDDRGEYRVSGLPPGDYFVSARSSRGPTPLRATNAVIEATYYPGTPALADAQRVRVELGAVVRLTFGVKQVTPVRLTGIVRAADETVPERHFA
jgi:hypothetical protein